jgi:hypothetical protein
MKLSKKAAAFTAAAIATVSVSAGLAVSLAGVASASGRAPAPVYGGPGFASCANGIYAGYCGTQKSATGFYLAVGRGGLIGTKDPQPGTAEFFWFADASKSAADNDKYAEYAPDGIASDMVMAEVGNRVVLVKATGATDQKWVYTGTGWKNVASGHVLQAPASNGGQVSAVTAPAKALTSQTWTFVTPTS